MIEQKVVELLAAEATVAALVGARIHPLRMPQGGALPAITYGRISREHGATMEGLQGPDRTRIQFDVWAERYMDARAVADAVRGALDCHRDSDIHSAFLANERDFYEQDARGPGKDVYRVSADYFVRHSAAA